MHALPRPCPTLRHDPTRFELGIRFMIPVTKKADVNLRPAIVVTGASSGIGREIARVAARERQPLLLVARSNDALL